MYYVCTRIQIHLWISWWRPRILVGPFLPNRKSEVPPRSACGMIRSNFSRTSRICFFWMLPAKLQSPRIVIVSLWPVQKFSKFFPSWEARVVKAHQMGLQSISIFNATVSMHGKPTCLIIRPSRASLHSEITHFQLNRVWKKLLFWFGKDYSPCLWLLTANSYYLRPWLYPVYSSIGIHLIVQTALKNFCSAIGDAMDALLGVLQGCIPRGSPRSYNEAARSTCVYKHAVKAPIE